MLKQFSTPAYRGFWLSYSGDRMLFRNEVEAILRQELEDPLGFLEVNASGPHWRGKSLQLSYAHTEKAGILVYSENHALGVDVEALDRRFHGEISALAKRFFHEEEAKELERLERGIEQKRQFLEVWVKKEAYAKLSRRGLKGSLHEALKTQTHVCFEPLPVTPQELLAWVAYKALI